jgi:hypothetical protein
MSLVRHLMNYRFEGGEIYYTNAKTMGMSSDCDLINTGF